MIEEHGIETSPVATHAKPNCFAPWNGTLQPGCLKKVFSPKGSAVPLPTTLHKYPVGKRTWTSAGFNLLSSVSFLAKGRVVAGPSKGQSESSSIIFPYQDGQPINLKDHRAVWECNLPSAWPSNSTGCTPIFLVISRQMFILLAKSLPSGHRTW